MHSLKGEEPPLGHHGPGIAASEAANQHHDLQAGKPAYEAPEGRCVPAPGAGAIRNIATQAGAGIPDHGLVAEMLASSKKSEGGLLLRLIEYVFSVLGPGASNLSLATFLSWMCGRAPGCIIQIGRSN